MSGTEMTGAEMIAAERRRQIEVEGWTPEHDDQHSKAESADAARCYLVAARYSRCIGRPMPVWARDQGAYWPWDEEWWKPSMDPVRDLVKAGALIAAEIDRLTRERARG